MEITINNISRLRLTYSAKGWMVYGLGLICLALFATAAYDKVTDHQTFLKGLSRVSLIGEAAVYISWIVPITETLISVLLIVPNTQRLGLYGFSILMTIFTIYILSMWLWAEKLPCHCNLIIDQLSWGAHIWFNLGFIALSVCALWLGRAKNKN